MPATDAMGRTIREFLKQGTAAEHDTLDARLGSLVLLWLCRKKMYQSV